MTMFTTSPCAVSGLSVWLYSCVQRFGLWDMCKFLSYTILTCFESLLPTCSLEDVEIFVTLESASDMMAIAVGSTAMYVITHIQKVALHKTLIFYLG